jgi:hypothetical protein
LIKAGAAAVIFCHYVARHIMAVLCPLRLCGLVGRRRGDCTARSEHNARAQERPHPIVIPVILGTDEYSGPLKGTEFSATRAMSLRWLGQRDGRF